MRHLVAFAVLALALPGCAGPRANEVRGIPAGTVEGIAPRYQPLFEALRDAVEADEDETARQIADNLAARLALEPEGTRGRRDAQRLLQGFERVLDGRALVDSLDLRLALREESGGRAVRVVLRARAERRTRLELRPAAASLLSYRVTLAEDGRETSSVRTQGVPNLDVLAVDSDGWVEVPLATFPTSLPRNAIAARTHWSLSLLAGDVVEESERYPAMHVPVGAVERVDLAHYLPNGPVEPAELLTYLQRPDVALPPILERTVRIVPERREEALDLLAPLVERSTPEALERMIPSLRWLARTSAPGRDPLAWKEWLANRPVEEREEQGLEFSRR